MSDSDLESENVSFRKRKGRGSDDDSSFTFNEIVSGDTTSGEISSGQRRHRRALKRVRGEIFSPRNNQGNTADDAIQIVSDDEAANGQTNGSNNENASTTESFIEIRRNPLKIVWKVPKVLWGGIVSGFAMENTPHMTVTLMKEAFEFKSTDESIGLCVSLADRLKPFEDIACNTIHSPYFIAFRPRRGVSTLNLVNTSSDSGFDQRYIVIFFEQVDEPKAMQVIGAMEKMSAKVEGVIQFLKPEDLSRYDNIHPRPRRGRTRAATQKTLLYDHSLTGNIVPERTTILQYPIQATTGNRITLTEDDLDVLDPENFLNDSIVDFYLLYLKDHFNCERFHIFNSFFYKKYTSAGAAPQAGQTESYKAVKNWTRNIDLFKKDFLIMPVCDKMHWSCVIACYPGLLGEMTEIDPDAVAFPCLLLLDSLGSHCAPKLFRMFRNYLSSEWNERHPRAASSSDDDVIETFRATKINMPGYVVQVPQQTNDCDCGLFMLHYIEEFLANPFTDLRKSQVHNPTWFDPEVVVNEKRTVIRKLVLDLSEMWKNPFGISRTATPEGETRLPADSGDKSSSISIVAANDPEVDVPIDVSNVSGDQHPITRNVDVKDIEVDVPVDSNNLCGDQHPITKNVDVKDIEVDVPVNSNNLCGDQSPNTRNVSAPTIIREETEIEVILDCETKLPANNDDKSSNTGNVDVKTLDADVPIDVRNL